LSVNDWHDYAVFREALEQAGAGARVAIIGGGLIGSEFANDLAHGGYAVQVIDPGRWPVGQLVTEEQGRALQQALEGFGVVFHWEDVAQSISPESGAYTLTLRSGAVVQADVVLSAVGLRPRTTLAQAMGLTIGRGIEVDDHGRTSDPHVFALGDCAAYRSAAKPEWFDGAARPLPFVLPIMTAAKAIAATLTGEVTPVRFAPMSVRVKTPAYPLTVAA
jgi:rubredoxin---NAD+ reductase